MAVSAAPYEDLRRHLPGERFPRANAFRVLSLGADAEPRQIYRQQQRLLVAMELGEQEGKNAYGLPPLNHVSKEEILWAVNVLERSDFRLFEELFWVHEMEGLIDGRLDNVLGAQRLVAAGNTTQGAVAKHNLAVILSILGQESTGNRRLEYWKEALKIWRELLDDDLFWSNMKDRSRRSGAQIWDARMMRITVCRELSSIFSEEILQTVEFRELAAVPALARIAMEHRSWLNADAALASVGKQVSREGFAALGAILERLEETATEDDEAAIRGMLAEREKDLRSFAAEYGAILRSLGELADADGWDDAVALSKQKLSAAYVDLLDDPHEAVRLIAQARERVHDPELLEAMKRDWQRVQRTVFCRDAEDLAHRGDFAGADRKLSAALAISMDGQRTEIKIMQDRNRRQRDLIDRDRQHRQRADLCQEAGALLDRGEFAAAEYKLAAALAVSTESQKSEIKAMQGNCRWARVLRGVDTTQNKPFLFTSNGIGARFYGKRDFDLGTQSYVTTHWLAFLFVPLFPLGAYRVTDAHPRSYVIRGRVPLPNHLRRARWAIEACVLVLVLATGIYKLRPISRAATLSVEAGRGGAVLHPGFALHLTNDKILKEKIKVEQAALSALAQSLANRQRELQLEGADLERQRGYLAGVATSYAGEKVPEGGQALFDTLFTEYASRRKEYQRKRVALSGDLAVYRERANALQIEINQSR